ncbi:MAG: hypothetical protein JXA30_21160 [Deltaproteobacteria bacterium]|nr:hypothetical protein [Deltaproteobacteria bacterium]
MIKRGKPLAFIHAEAIVEGKTFAKASITKSIMPLHISLQDSEKTLGIFGV